MSSPVQSRRFRWLWLAAGLLMLAEFLLFDRMTSLHHASVYPRWNDQIQYLRESYNAYDQLQAHGLIAALRFALTKTALQGTLHDVSALLVFAVAGSASRSAALSLNLLVFLAWQVSLLVVVPRLTGSRALGWMAFGLLLCVAGPWAAGPGSAVDFRLDHAAMCLFGITGSLALLTRGFRSLGWSAALGLAVGLTLLERFLTGVYFAVIFCASAAWIMCGDARWLRLRHLLLAGLVAAVIAGPIFWVNRTAIYTYYWVGHITGAEGAARLRAMDHLGALQFVFGHLADLQLGPVFGWTVAAVTGLLLLLWVAARQPAPAKADRDWLFFGFAFLFLPAGVLAVHPQKSEYVLGILVPGVVLLVLWGWVWLWRRIDFAGGGAARRMVPLVLALGTLATGETYFTRRQLWQPHSGQFLADARQVNRVADYIFATTRARRWPNPSIGVDQIVDYFDAQILEIICYERHKVWTPFVIELPQGIVGEKDDVILHRLTLCDFVLLTDEMPGDGFWPYDKQMRRLYPQLKSWCDEHLRQVGTYELFGRRMSLYERRVNP